MTNAVDHLYVELRRIAGSLMRRERPGHTLQATALAHEAFLSVGAESDRWENTAHYLGAAAQAMRRALLQHARAKRALKRGGAARRVELDDIPLSQPDFLDVHEAIEALGRHDSSLLEIVDLRYFAGCSLEEVAELTGRSLATVKRDWAYTRSWLHAYLTRPGASAGDGGRT